MFRRFRGLQRFQRFQKFQKFRNIRNIQNIRKLSIKKELSRFLYPVYQCVLVYQWAVV